MIIDKHDVKKIRRVLGITKPKLAQRVGVSSTYISDIETGRRAFSDKVARRIIEEFNLSDEIIMEIREFVYKIDSLQEKRTM